MKSKEKSEQLKYELFRICKGRRTASTKKKIEELIEALINVTYSEAYNAGWKDSGWHQREPFSK